MKCESGAIICYHGSDWQEPYQALSMPFHSVLKPLILFLRDLISVRLLLVWIQFWLWLLDLTLTTDCFTAPTNWDCQLVTERRQVGLDSPVSNIKLVCLVIRNWPRLIDFKWPETWYANSKQWNSTVVISICELMYPTREIWWWSCNIMSANSC